MSANFLDIIYVIITSLSVASGIYKGSVKLTISFIFFILSFIFTYLGFTPLAEIIHEYIPNNFIAHVASIFVLYLVCAIFCGFISGRLQALVKDIGGGGVDRFLGLILGAIRGIIMSLVIFTLIMIITSQSYKNAHNVLELVAPKEQTKQEPHWISYSRLSSMLQHLLNQTIDLIGKETLKKTPLPKYIGSKDQ